MNHAAASAVESPLLRGNSLHVILLGGLYSAMAVGRPSKRQRTEFGQRLFKRREALGLTQADVAAHLGLSQRAYSSWERESVAIQPEKLKTLADVLGTTVSELVGESPSPRAVLPRARLQEVFQAAQQLPRTQQNLIADWVEAYVTQQRLKLSS